MRSLRPTLAMAAAVAVLAACSSGGGSVPEDQALTPAEAPEGWTEHEIGGVTFSTPAAWEELELPAPTEGTARAGYADAPGPSGTTGGVIVMVLPDPRRSARTESQTFVTDARNREQADDDEMTEIVWPDAEEAWYSTYVAQVGDEPAPHPTAHLVLDLENGYQVQVTVRAEEGTEAEEHLHDVLATVDVSGDLAVTSGA